MSENWRPIPGYPGYEASDLGRVRSTKRSTTPRLLTLSLKTGGYIGVTVSRGNGGETPAVHSLVMLAFVGPRPVDCKHIRHLDGNPANNVLTNLRYGTPSENGRDAVEHGRNLQANKTHCPAAHEYSPENIYTPPSRPRERRCRACNAARYQASKVAA